MNNINKTAFTLVELLVVIAIIGILSGLIIVGMNSSTQSANIAKSQVFSASLRDSLLMNLISEWKFDGSGVADGGAVTSSYLQDTWKSNVCSNTGVTVYSGNNCVYGSCLKFNGSSDRITCGSDSSLNITSAITMEAWLKTSQLYTDVYRNLVSKGGFTAYNLFAEWSANGGTVNFDVDSGGTRYNYTGPSFAGNIDKWMYVVGTYDSATGDLKIYYNGKVYISGNIGAGKAIGTNSSVLAIGGNSGTNYFNGYIDQVRLYDAAIPASQVSDHYYAGLNHLLAKGIISSVEYNKILFNN